MKDGWSKPLTYDLTRTTKRASVPRSFEQSVPEGPGVYVICLKDAREPSEAIIDIGECGPRPKSNPRGLRGRLASNVPHSASECIARDIASGQLRACLSVVWVSCPSKDDAKAMQDALVCLFKAEFGRQPRFNRKVERSLLPQRFAATYDALKMLVRETATS